MKSSSTHGFDLHKGLIGGNIDLNKVQKLCSRTLKQKGAYLGFQNEKQRNCLACGREVGAMKHVVVFGY